MLRATRGMFSRRSTHEEASMPTLSYPLPQPYPFPCPCPCPPLPYMPVLIRDPRLQ